MSSNNFRAVIKIFLKQTFPRVTKPQLRWFLFVVYNRPKEQVKTESFIASIATKRVSAVQQDTVVLNVTRIFAWPSVYLVNKYIFNKLPLLLVPLSK